MVCGGDLNYKKERERERRNQTPVTNAHGGHFCIPSVIKKGGSRDIKAVKIRCHRGGYTSTPP